MARVGVFIYRKDEPPACWTPPESLAKSLVYICTWCGETYAKLTVRDRPDVPEPFSAVHGCCPSCPGNQYYLPGSLECLSLVKWDVPPEVLSYQFNVELTFAERNLSHAHRHPSLPL